MDERKKKKKSKRWILQGEMQEETFWITFDVLPSCKCPQRWIITSSSSNSCFPHSTVFFLQTYVSIDNGTISFNILTFVFSGMIGDNWDCEAFWMRCPLTQKLGDQILLLVKPGAAEEPQLFLVWAEHPNLEYGQKSGCFPQKEAGPAVEPAPCPATGGWLAVYF